MGKIYYRTPQLATGEGSFKCHNCGKMLARKLNGSVYEAEFECPRCHTIINVKCREPIGQSGDATQLVSGDQSKEG